MQAPWGFASVFVALLFFGWVAGRFMSNERIAILQERVDAYKDKLDGASPDEARRQIEELKESIQRLQDAAGRILTSKQMEAITQMAQRSSGRVCVTYDSATPGGGSLQSQFLKAFRAAGWIASGGLMAGGDDPSDHEFVLNVPNEETPASKAARAALEAAKIPFESGKIGDYHQNVDAEIVIFDKVS